MLTVNDLSLHTIFVDRIFVRPGNLVRISFGEAYDDTTVNYQTSITVTRENAKIFADFIYAKLKETEPKGNRQQRRAEGKKR